MARLIQNSHVYKLIWYWMRGIWMTGLPKHSFFLLILYVSSANSQVIRLWICQLFSYRIDGNVTNPRWFCSCSCTDWSLKVPRCEHCTPALQCLLSGNRSLFAVVNYLFYICLGPAVLQSFVASVAR